MSPRPLIFDHDLVRIDVDLQPPLLRLVIRGELDLSNDGMLEQVGCLDLSRITVVRVDLSPMSFCDIAGFRAIAQLHDDLRTEQRSVRLERPRRSFKRLAELLGRDDLVSAARHFG